MTLEKTRDFVASLVGDAPLEVTSRSWRDKLEDPSTCSITVGWRWFTDEPDVLTWLVGMMCVGCLILLLFAGISLIVRICWMMLGGCGFISILCW